MGISLSRLCCQCVCFRRIKDFVWISVLNFCCPPAALLLVHSGKMRYKCTTWCIGWNIKFVKNPVAIRRKCVMTPYVLDDTGFSWKMVKAILYRWLQLDKVQHMDCRPERTCRQNRHSHAGELVHRQMGVTPCFSCYILLLHALGCHSLHAKSINFHRALFMTRRHGTIRQYS